MAPGAEFQPFGGPRGLSVPPARSGLEPTYKVTGAPWNKVTRCTMEPRSHRAPWNQGHTEHHGTKGTLSAMEQASRSKRLQRGYLMEVPILLVGVLLVVAI